MGKPAARFGDTTAHGGTILVGFPTVLIGGMPAARVTDMHVCPLVTGLVPHVGGPIAMGSTGVFIGGKPAARMGDMVTCVGPPDTIAMGCTTVLIGEIGGGGGGGAGSSGIAGALRSAMIAGQAPPEKKEESHFIDMTFVDDANLPIGGVQYELTYPDNSKYNSYLSGRIRIGGVPQGNYTAKLRAIVNAQWSTRKAKIDDTVKIHVDVIGIDSGTKAKLEIHKRDPNISDIVCTSIDAEVKNNAVDAQWKIEYSGNEGDPIMKDATNTMKYSSPQFFFVVTIDDLHERSGFLNVSDDLEIVLKNETGKAIPNEKYIARLSSGEISKGQLDQNGKAVIKNIPAGKSSVSFPGFESAKKLPK
jgi:uncharacterized Zn-binding protein involved in type VI secretion